MHTFLIRTIDVNGNAYIAKCLLPFRHMFTFETCCAQQADTFKILRDKTFLTFRLTHSNLAVTFDKLCVTVLIQSRGSYDAICTWLRKRYRTPSARNLLLLSGLTNASLTGTAALWLCVCWRVIYGKFRKTTIVLTELALSISDQ